MLLLDPAHRPLFTCLSDYLLNNSQNKIADVCCDFDGASYKISTQPSGDLLISFRWSCIQQLYALGLSNLLAREYTHPALQISPSPEPGYDLSISLDIARTPSSIEERTIICQRLSMLKRNTLALPFEIAFDAQQQGRELEPICINYRQDESIYIKALPDRVTVIFTTTFKDETDRIFGKVFLQEFVDARRQPSIQNAPQVLYSPKEPPMELRNVPNLQAANNVGYVTFVLFPRHFTSGLAREECISRIQLFRDYFHYHIKCSKSYMHSRMRARVDSFLKVLNRAKPEKNEEKKTVSGKTFKRI